MSRRKFVFMPGDAADVLLFASIRRQMESPLGRLTTLDADQMWETSVEAVEEVLALFFAVDASMAECQKKFPDNADVATMTREWALCAPRALEYLNRLRQAPEDINIGEMANWFAFLTLRRQTMELNGIEILFGTECPVSG